MKKSKIIDSQVQPMENSSKTNKYNETESEKTSVSLKESQLALVRPIKTSMKSTEMNSP